MTTPKKGLFSRILAATRGLDPFSRLEGPCTALHCLCNAVPEDDAGQESLQVKVPLVGFANELDLGSGEGWAQVAPYGEWPHADGLQRFGRAEADKMVSYFRKPWNRIKRAIVGLPIFAGHPDHKAFANSHTDRTRYGHVLDLEARDDGLYGRLVLSEDGADKVEKDGLKFLSPHWLANTLPSEGGRKVFAPVFLVSLGLTARPNIPGASLVNSQPDTAMPEWIKKLLGLANEASDDQVRASIEALQVRPEPTALANETARATTLAAELEAQRTALANERKARIGDLVTAAVHAGRILEADGPAWTARLERDFATEATALANAKAALKTEARSAALGAQKPASSARDQFVALVNEAMPAHGLDWGKAWEAVKATSAGQALYQRMNTPQA